MDENPLDKVIRLSASQKPGKRKPTIRLGNPYRAAWGNIAVGDVVELGTELWKVIPSSSYPGKPPANKAAGFGKPPAGISDLQQGAGQGGVGLAAPPAGPAKPVVPLPATGPGAPPPDANAMSPAGPVGAGPTSTLYLQDMRHTGSYDTLTLPSSHIVTVVPVLP